jgi:hypothetical protein
MRYIRKSAVVVLVFACWFTPRALGQSCGKERWSVKTGTDSGVSQVGLANPRTANITDAGSLRRKVYDCRLVVEII